MVDPATAPLARTYDLAMLDLDGVVYIGPDAVPGAATAIAAARGEGQRFAFITNNASRRPAAVGQHLRDLGVDVDDADVVTSAQAAAREAVDRFGAGARVVCLGADGLRWALEEVGLVPVGVDEDADVVVSGYGPDLAWKEIMRAAVRIRGGLAWIACNTDLTIPTPDGPAPGHGVLVRMIREFADVVPGVAGKPARPLLDETVRRVGGSRVLMVGDRLDTDIEGAARAGVDSLLVLTGVSTLDDVLAAPPGRRPTYVADDLAGLLAVHPPARRDAEGWRAGESWARVRDGVLEVSSGPWGPATWQAAMAAAWEHLDADGVPVRIGTGR